MSRTLDICVRANSLEGPLCLVHVNTSILIYRFTIMHFLMLWHVQNCSFSAINLNKQGSAFLNLQNQSSMHTDIYLQMLNDRIWCTVKTRTLFSMIKK